MLDLNKLSQQLQKASLEFEQESNTLARRVQYALQVWNKAVLRDHELVEKLLQAQDTLPWSMARPLEPLAEKYPLPTIPLPHTIVATDGSQIVPSYHEISPCYLINIGKIVYYYGTGEIPIQESEPFFYYREQDLFTQIRRQFISVSEDIIGIERSLTEMQELAHLCQLAVDKGYPAIAMVDGSLMSILPDIQMNHSSELQERVLNRLLGSLDQIRALQIPLCGYISHSRRNEVMQFLRLQLCPFQEAFCDTHCPEGEEQCHGLVPLADRTLWEALLNPGERSPLFISTVKYLEKLEAHQTCFFYLHAGHEIARIEIPRWVADQSEWLNLIHSLCYEQVQKGFGYPVALAEAHNRAVVKGSDRAQFYAMLSRKMIEGNRRVSLSNKELKKRGGIA